MISARRWRRNRSSIIASVADFGVEGRHLLGQAGDRGSNELLSGHDGVLSVSGPQGFGRDGIGVAGLAFPQTLQVEQHRHRAARREFGSRSAAAQPC